MRDLRVKLDAYQSYQLANVSMGFERMHIPKIGKDSWAIPANSLFSVVAMILKRSGR